MSKPSTPGPTATPPAERGIFCNRTLNMRSIRAVGYDMDYTLIHYRVAEWEGCAYRHLQDKLRQRGWPVADLKFDPDSTARGLVFDLELGNVLKANRFGYVKQASHGTRPLDHDQVREQYAQTLVDLSDSRFVFANTLFSICQGCMYAQLVDRLDAGELPGVLGYGPLFQHMSRALDETHMEGKLKAQIMADPDRFVALDPELPLALLDQKRAGKRLLLITNSGWGYTKAMMRYAFDHFVPEGMTWRDLFDVIIVSARKPDFFSGQSPLFEVVSEDGLLKPAIAGLKDGIYYGGSAALVEERLGMAGDQILYVGDHIYGDVHVSKRTLRWRTCLVLRELEPEIQALDQFSKQQKELSRLMTEKERLEFDGCQLRLRLMRTKESYGPATGDSEPQLSARLQKVRDAITELDAQISPLAAAAGAHVNPRWGPLMRAGNDKSHLARQVERYADIYTSRVSNFLYQTPFFYLRVPRGSLPHDQGHER